MADYSDDDEILEYAKCAWQQLGATEIPRLAAAFRARLSNRNKKVKYGLSVEFPDADEAGMLRPVASSRVSETGETRLLPPIPMNGQGELPLEDEEG